MTKGWQTTRLGSVCAFDKVQGTHRGLPYVGLEQIESNTGRFIGSREPQSVKSSTFRFSREHVLYGRLRPYLNKAIAPDFDGHSSTEIFPLKPAPELSREYLLYWLLADETMERIDATCTGTRMPRADMTEVLEFDFPLPPLAEQRRIVGLLDQAFAGLATAKAHADKNRQNARALFESHLHSVFRQDDKGWELKKFGDVCQTGCGGTPLKLRKEYYEGGTIPWLLSGEVRQGQIHASTKFITKQGLENSAAKLFPKDTVLIAMYGATAGQVGVLRFEAATNQAICGIYPSKQFVPEFLYYCFLEKQDELVAQAAGNAQPNISQIKIRNTLVPVPTLGEQRRVVSDLDAISNETQRLESLYRQKLAALDALKKSLLHQAFSGAL